MIFLLHESAPATKSSAAAGQWKRDQSKLRRATLDQLNKQSSRQSRRHVGLGAQSERTSGHIKAGCARA
jgi:hypothetical protein